MKQAVRPLVASSREVAIQLPVAGKIHQTDTAVGKRPDLCAPGASAALSVLGEGRGRYDAWPDRTAARRSGADDRDIRVRPRRFHVPSPECSRLESLPGCA